MSLSEVQKQVLIGTLLGDGHISKQLKRLEFGHSIKQFEYLYWKNNVFENFSNYEKPSSNEKICWATTRTDNLFEKYRDIFYPDDKKIIPEDVLNQIEPLGLAVWYMDDGSSNGSRIILCTDAFSQKDVINAKEILNKRFDLSFRHSNSDNRLFISNYKDASKFVELIKDKVISSMQYKLHLKTPKHTWRRDLTPEIVIKYLSNNNYDLKKAADHFGVSCKTIKRRLDAL